MQTIELGHTGQQVSRLALGAMQMGNATGESDSIRILDRRPAQLGDVERTYADLTRSTTELGYRPKVTLAEGLQRFVTWFREYGHLYSLPGERAEKGTVA